MKSEWLKAAIIRAVRTCAQAAIAAIGSAAVLAQVDWKIALSTTVLAGILSLLTSLAGLPEVSDDPSTRPDSIAHTGNDTDKALTDSQLKGEK